MCHLPGYTFIGECDKNKLIMFAATHVGTGVKIQLAKYQHKTASQQAIRAKAKQLGKRDTLYSQTGCHRP